MAWKIKRTIIGACTISLLVNIVPGLFTHIGSALDASPWLSTADLSLANLGKIPDGHVPPDSVNGNIDCSQQQLTIRPEIFTATIPQVLIQSELTVDSCVIQTAYGSVDTRSSYIQPFYADIAGRLTARNASVGYLGVPRSLIGIGITGSGYMQITTNVLAKLQAATNPLTQEVSYSPSAPPDFMLSDRAGHTLPVSYDSISFSSNGLWMVVNSPGHALLRVNLSSFEIVPFGQPLDYENGIGPNPQTAITNDGRYVTVGSSSQQTLKFYDLASCGSTPSTITTPVACKSRDLWKVLQTNISGFSTIGTIRFVDDDILSLYAGSQNNISNAAGSTKVFSISKYNLSPSGKQYNQLDYLAMGDSISSGEGAYSYRAGTDTENNKCHLSVDSYPFLMAARLNKNSFHSVSCSGARIEDVLGTGQDYNGQVKDRIPLFNRDVPALLQSFNPGLIEQIQFTTHYLPKSITITISGDDVGFSDILKECVADILHPTCYDTYEDRQELIQNINSQLLPLTTLYSELQRQSTPSTNIYAVGYPQLVYPGGNCANNVHLDKRELQLAVNLVDQLNSVIKSAASSAGAQYIDVSQSLAGHRLCETISSNSAVNGLTIGNDIPGFTHGPIGNESFHPNQLGHQLMAKTVLAATKGFELSNNPKPVASKPAAVIQNNALADAVKTERIVKKRIPKEITPSSVRPGQTYAKKIKGASIGLAPNHTYTLAIDNKPTSSSIADTDANLNIVANIPANLPSGYHVLDVTGTDLSGHALNIHQTVYLNSNPAGALNSTAPSIQQGCVVVPKSGQDLDADGIDDACDGFIGEPPTHVLPQNAGVQTTTVPDILPAAVSTDLIVQPSSAQNALPPSTALSNVIQNGVIPTTQSQANINQIQSAENSLHIVVKTALSPIEKDFNKGLISLGTNIAPTTIPIYMATGNEIITKSRNSSDQQGATSYKAIRNAMPPVLVAPHINSPSSHNVINNFSKILSSKSTLKQLSKPYDITKPIVFAFIFICFVTTVSGLALKQIARRNR